MPNHFALKLTTGGGPNPIWELHLVAAMFDDSDDGTTWVATHKSLAGLEINGSSQAILIARNDRGFRIVQGRILQKGTAETATPAARERYEGYQGLQTYVQLAEVGVFDVQSLNELPGGPTTGRTAAESFKGNASLVYWDFKRAAKKASSPTDTEFANSKKNRLRHKDRPQMTPPSTPSRVGTGKEPEPPKFPLYGVDFSGALERDGRNNKLWIASWNGRTVKLEHGGSDPGFGRADLANRILASTGFWVIDFPFGISAVTLGVLGIQTWTQYLDWTAAGSDAKERRNTARLAMEGANLPWHQRRAVDLAHATTWAPLFEYLYRQTLNGARDVLGPLQASGRGRCRVLPFHESGDPASVPHVLEGFPGHTLTDRGLPTVGYKKRTQAGMALRQQIVDALLTAGLPITIADQQRAIADAEGDAVDALVLLLAARRSARRNAAEWNNARNQCGAEGWFVD